jgi:di/tricarboxylate transporter
MAIVFLIMGYYLSGLAPSAEIAWVMAILLLTIYLFIFEIVGVDVAAISIMVILGLTTLFAPYMGLQQGLVPNKHLFDGFASNAVMSIVAVMIIGAGLDKTGLMSKVATFILQVGGKTESRIIPIISGTVAFISSFMQNVGAAALFLPVVSRISSRSGLPMSRLLMPMGFCAILGGTITMVGSSPLILLNDLILTSNKALPATQQMETWSLFSVTPIGIVLVIAGILYFVLAGRYVLPSGKDSKALAEAINPMKYFKDIYGIDYRMTEFVVPFDSKLIGEDILGIEKKHKVRVIAICEGRGEAPIWPNRETTLKKDETLCVLAGVEGLASFREEIKAEPKKSLDVFSDLLSSNHAGMAEIVIAPGSSLIGKTATDVWMRKTYGFALMALHRGGQTIREGDGARDTPFQAGDTLVGHISWDALARLEKDRNFVVVTTEYPHEDLRPHKVGWAGLFFAIALSLVIFSELRLSVSLLVGALGMIVSGVIKIEEAYQAVSWKTVFLLASLIPLGLAVETSGTARWIAEATLSLFGDEPLIWMVQLAVAVLATFFTLVMSNVGATVLLVPLAVNIAIGAGADPAVFALTVALATSNSFLIPTHQVNALIMGPGGYGVPDYMKAGGIMTVLFLVVMMVMMNIVY